MALPPPKIERQEVPSEVHRGGTSIYRKKIDTQKVYGGITRRGTWDLMPGRVDGERSTEGVESKGSE